MDSHALLTVGILSAIGFCSCQNELLLNGPLNGAVGESVKFTLINPPSAPPFRINWDFSGNREVTIFTSIGNVEDTHADYRGRISVDKTTASLELRGLTQNDTGLYTVKLFIISGGVESQGGTSLTVFEQISNVTAEANPNELVEFNSSVILTCSASGSSPSFRWFNRSAVVTGSDNKTLTVLNVTRYDTGPFQCEAFNDFSAQMSSEVNLTIAYGPDSAVVTVKPPASFYSSGSDITLSCSSESKPAAQFHWVLSGTLLGREGPELRLENVQASQSGAYSCRAYNSKTHRSETSSPSTITVLERISGAAITITGGILIAVNSSVNLTCDAQGSIITREWRKDGNPLHGVNIDELNRTVSISPVKKEDSGDYACQVSNPISSETASIGLIVISEGSLGGPGGLSAGAIAGIVIAIIVIIVAVILISIFVVKKKGKLGLPMGRQAPQQNNASTELDYADISHFQKRNGQKEDLGNGGDGGDGGVAGATIYAAVKLPRSTGPNPGQNSVALPRARLGNGVNVGEQNTELQYSSIKHPTSSMSGPQAHRPKGQAPGPPNQVPDVTYAQVKKK